MVEASANQIEIQIDPDLLNGTQVATSLSVKKKLSQLWESDEDFLNHYLALFSNKPISEITANDSFITLSFISHGYIEDPLSPIDIDIAKQQIEIDLEILNKESLFTKEESIFFDTWWPKPKYNSNNYSLHFGVATRDYQGKVFNRTINKIILTRYGHLLLNYNVSEKDLALNETPNHWVEKINNIADSIHVKSGYSYDDISQDEDYPSRSKMINLVLSSEIL